MINIENIYFSDVGLCSFLLYCTRKFQKSECEISAEKLKADLLIGNSEFYRLMKIIKTEKEICENCNADDVLALRDYRLKIQFDKSFLSKFEEIKNAEKKGKNMIKKVNRSTFVFCGTLTEEEKEIKNLLENYIEKSENEQKQKPKEKAKATMTRQELSLFFKQQKEEKAKEKNIFATLDKEIKNFATEKISADKDDDFDAEDVLPDELFV